MKTIFGIIALILLLSIPGCQKDNLQKDLKTTTWYLQSINHTDTSTEEMVPENLKGMNVVFSDSNTLHAKSSCNVFDGNFNISGSDSIHIKVGTTYIYCTDLDKRLWDSLFYRSLNNSVKYSLIEGTLSILTSENTILIFK